MPSSSPVKITTTRTRVFNGATTHNVSNTTTFTSSFIGSSNGNYKKAIAEGSNATTAATGVLYTGGSVSVSAAHLIATNGSGITLSGTNSEILLPSGVAPIVPGLVTKLDNKARAKAFNKLRSGFNASTFLGEAREALAMLKSPAMGLRKAVDVYRSNANSVRSRWRKLSDYRRAAADLWLEVQFGWKPLLSDVANAAEAYANLSEERVTITFNATETETSRSSTRTSTSIVDVVAVDVLSTIESKFSVRYKGGVSLKSAGGRQSFEFGATLPDFIPTAWELLPWSFIIDYFSNVGAIANSWSTAQLVKVGWTCRTEHEEHVFKVQTLGARSSSIGYKLISYSPGMANLNLKKFKRTAPDGVPLPMLQLDTDLSFGQGLNIAALLAAQKRDVNYKP